MKHVLVYVLVLVLVRLTMQISGQSLSSYSDPMGLLVLSGSLLAAGVCFSRSDWRNLWQALQGQHADSAMCLQAAQQLQLMQRLIFAALGLQVLMELLSMLADLENMATVGRFLALLLLNGLYVLLLAWLVLLPLQLRLKYRAQSADSF